MKQLKLLIVDDDEVDRMAVRRALSSLSYDLEVSEAEDGEAAIAQLKSTYFDCVFLDFLLPDTDGLEMLRTVQDERIKSPIIILTGQGDEELAVKIMREGAADYLSKDKLSANSISRSVNNVLRFQEAKLKQEAAEEALLHSEAHNRTLIETIPYGIQENDLNGVITFSNPAHLSLLGYIETEVIGKSIWDFSATAEDSAKLRKMFQELVDNKPSPITYETNYRTNNGDVIDVQVDWNYKTNADGDITGFISVITDITESKRAAEEIKEARDKALESSRLKSEFLANMSHEIRTPMNGVLGMLSLMSDTELSRLQNEYVDNAYKSAESLLNIINDILDFSKVEAGKLELENIDFDLHQVFDDVVDLFARQAQEKGIELACFIPAECSTLLRGDPNRIRQVLVNLIGNAIKFTKEGEVELKLVSCEEYGGKYKLRIEITDTGIGIAPEMQDHIFDSFSQADGSTTREYGGTGLGLSICHQLVQMMSGEIGVESNLPHGSVFWITALLDKAKDLTCRQTNAEDLKGRKALIVGENHSVLSELEEMFLAWQIGCDLERDAQDAWNIISEQSDGYHFALIDVGKKEYTALVHLIRNEPRLAEFPLVLISDLGEPSPLGLESCVYVSKPLQQSQLYEGVAQVLNLEQEKQAKQTVLTDGNAVIRGEIKYSGRVVVVEDNIINQKVACGMLKNLGCKVDVASNGKEAVEAVADSFYDVIFMDCQMPVMDGYEATSLIRESASGEADGNEELLARKHIPIVAITANAMKGDLEHCLAVGMDDYLAKPIQSEELRDMLEKWMPSSKLSGKGFSNCIDESALTELNEMLGENWGEFIDTYLESASQHIKDIGSAYAEKNIESLVRAAHPLKSSSAQIGAMCLSKMSKIIEEQGREGVTKDAGSLIPLMQQEYQRVREILIGHKESGKPVLRWDI